MNIIFGQEIADEVSSKNLVLELETFEVNGKLATAYCVVPQEAIPLEEMPQLEVLRELHKAVIVGIKNDDWKMITEGIGHLRGKFKGEMDSFYDEILSRKDKKV